jgi:hypothetical protein
MGLLPLLQILKDVGIAIEAEGNRCQYRLHTLFFWNGERSHERCLHPSRMTEESALPLESGLPAGQEKRQNNEPVGHGSQEICACYPWDESAMGVQRIMEVAILLERRTQITHHSEALVLLLSKGIAQCV